MKKEKRRLSNLVMDEWLLSIRKLNPAVVSRYRQNYRNGAEFPPIIIEKKTNHIVSGNHRYSAMLQEFGPDYVTEVIVKEYESDKDVLIDFTNENIKHGQPIDGWTKKLLIRELLNKGISEKEISQIFNISIVRIEELCGEMIGVIIGKNNTIQKPIKRGFYPGRNITLKEYEEHQKSDRGLTIGQKVFELSRWLNGDLVIHNEKNMEYVKMLQAACNSWLEKVAVTT